MRCPKCHYISFGSVDRCRNCGYELLLVVETPLDLPIQSGDQVIGPLGDFVLSERGSVAAARPFSESTSPEATSARRSSLPAGTPRLDLPLFGAEGGDDAPLVTPSAIPRPPLSVRRGEPAIARPRPEPALLTDDPEPGPRGVVRHRDGRPMETMSAREGPLDASKSGALASASVAARLFAGLVDILVLGTIDGAILYFTLRLLDLPLAEVRSLPPVPLGVFLLLLNGGYLAIFTAAGGQTIGKMLTGIRVVAERSAEDLESDGAGLRVSLGAAVLRATAYLVSLLPAGLGFAALLFDPDGRALHDRLAETRVVKA